MSDQTQATKPSTRSGWKSALPLLAFLALAGLFVLRLQSGDHSALPSPLIGQPAPAFKLGPLAGADRPGLSDADLRQGKTTLINFFASWCGPCRVEHPTLMKISADETLKAMGVQLVGINYKDAPANALQLLSADGNPFAAIGEDLNGRVGIDWGTDRRSRNLYRSRRRDHRLQIYRADHRAGAQGNHPAGNRKIPALRADAACPISQTPNP